MGINLVQGQRPPVGGIRVVIRAGARRSAARRIAATVSRLPPCPLGVRGQGGMPRVLACAALHPGKTCGSRGGVIARTGATGVRVPTSARRACSRHAYNGARGQLMRPARGQQRTGWAR